MNNVTFSRVIVRWFDKHQEFSSFDYICKSFKFSANKKISSAYNNKQTLSSPIISDKQLDH